VILRPICSPLRINDRLKAGDANHDAIADGRIGSLFVPGCIANPWPGRLEGEINVAVVGHEIQHQRHGLDERCVHWCFDRPSLSPQLCAESLQRSGESLKVVARPLGHNIDVFGWQWRAMHNRGESADDDVLDALLIEDLADRPRIEHYAVFALTDSRIWLYISTS